MWRTALPHPSEELFSPKYQQSHCEKACPTDSHAGSKVTLDPDPSSSYLGTHQGSLTAKDNTLASPQHRGPSLTASAHLAVKSGAQKPNFLKSNPSTTTYESLNLLVSQLPHLYSGDTYLKGFDTILQGAQTCRAEPGT